jgi:hypothetical protein
LVALVDVRAKKARNWYLKPAPPVAAHPIVGTDFEDWAFCSLAVQLAKLKADQVTASKIRGIIRSRQLVIQTGMLVLYTTFYMEPI